jgi:hypothetical protein
MNVRMVLQGLAPAVHHRDDADLGAEMTRIGGDRAQRLGRGAEKNGVNRRLILECDCGDLGRYGEDDVEIRHRKQFGLPVGEPLGPRPLPADRQAVQDFTTSAQGTRMATRSSLDRGSQVRTRLAAGGKWIRTSGSGASGEADAILPVKDRPR